MIHIVDVQYYTVGKETVLKEACMFPFGHPCQRKYFAFRTDIAPLTVKDQRTSKYLYHQLGLLHWKEGKASVEGFTFRPGSILLCNGLEKSLFLKSLFPLCIVLNCNLSLPFIHMECPTRPHKQCALSKAMSLYHALIHKQND